MDYLHLLSIMVNTVLALVPMRKLEQQKALQLRQIENSEYFYQGIDLQARQRGSHYMQLRLRE